MSTDPSSAAEAMHEEEALGKAYDARLLLRLWPYIRRYVWRVALTLGLIVPIFIVDVAPDDNFGIAARVDLLGVGGAATCVDAGNVDVYVKLRAHYGLDLPICAVVDSVIQGKLNCPEALDQLLSRPHPDSEFADLFQS